MAVIDILKHREADRGPVKDDSREAQLQTIIREGNEYIRAHKDDNYAVLMQKEAEIEERCKKLHGYFYKEPDVQLLIREAAEKYQMEEGTRYSINKKGNRILNYKDR